MKPSTLELFACPSCQGVLALVDADGDPVEDGKLICQGCAQAYPIREGIPHFAPVSEQTGLNRRFAGMYDRTARIYNLLSRLTFAALGMNEDKARGGLISRLDLRGRRLLEISMGPGTNLKHIYSGGFTGDIFGLDLSTGQLKQCRRLAQRKGWQVELVQGNAERLPFREGIFDRILNAGAINFYTDPKAAMDEMVRVAAPGAKVVIADESERGAKSYEKTIPGFTSSFEQGRKAVRVPRELVPEGMLEVGVSEIWKGWFYCLEFRKPGEL